VSTRRTLAPDSVPRLPRGVRLRFDQARGAWVLLAPERLLTPDETAVDILKLCDGERSVAAIVEELGREYDAEPEAMTADVLAFLQDLADKGMIEP
jgi:pyrroloquinoline quinone biosynthesis protein D